MKELLVRTSASPGAAGPALRRLYLVRFAFAIAWAALLVVSGGAIGAVTAVLVVLYPLFDAGAAAVDLRSSSASSTRGLYGNIAISLLAAIGLGVALTSGIPAVLRVWGAWAVVAGLIQLAVAATRRSLGGQWPMILSGGVSVLAGTGFVLMASGPNPALTGVAGYAALGGIFFLASALRLGRKHMPRRSRTRSTLCASTRRNA
ncbi:hypothetical protein ACQEVB_40290 [Pseudonocardia sp. CA-107938]|uniref:hypothetical protein n=1 Tax=Pseudonocardia sp. CA-107938 TaxID=3240021 RepID=UPI003D8FA0EB